MLDCGGHVFLVVSDLEHPSLGCMGHKGQSGHNQGTIEAQGTKTYLHGGAETHTRPWTLLMVSPAGPLFLLMRACNDESLQGALDLGLLVNEALHHVLAAQALQGIVQRIDLAAQALLGVGELAGTRGGKLYNTQKSLGCKVDALPGDADILQETRRGKGGGVGVRMGMERGRGARSFTGAGCEVPTNAVAGQPWVGLIWPPPPPSPINEQAPLIHCCAAARTHAHTHTQAHGPHLGLRT